MTQFDLSIMAHRNLTDRHFVISGVTTLCVSTGETRQSVPNPSLAIGQMLVLSHENISATG